MESKRLKEQLVSGSVVFPQCGTCCHCVFLTVSFLLFSDFQSQTGLTLPSIPARLWRDPEALNWAARGFELRRCCSSTHWLLELFVFFQITCFETFETFQITAGSTFLLNALLRCLALVVTKARSRTAQARTEMARLKSKAFGLRFFQFAFGALRWARQLGEGFASVMLQGANIVKHSETRKWGGWKEQGEETIVITAGRTRTKPIFKHCANSSPPNKSHLRIQHAKLSREH